MTWWQSQASVTRQCQWSHGSKKYCPRCMADLRVPLPRWVGHRPRHNACYRSLQRGTPLEFRLNSFIWNPNIFHSISHLLPNTSRDFTLYGILWHCSVCCVWQCVKSLQWILSTFVFSSLLFSFYSLSSLFFYFITLFLSSLLFRNFTQLLKPGDDSSTKLRSA